MTFFKGEVDAHQGQESDNEGLNTVCFRAQALWCGSDPLIILDDAEVEEAAETCASGCLLNSGQSCAATKRFIVSAKIRGAFENQLVRKMKQVKVGDPVNADLRVGPLARKDFQEVLNHQIRTRIDKGARCLLGGAVGRGKGFFYPPTVLTDVQHKMPVYHKEAFGPVAIVIPAANESEAIRLANETNYGAGATVFTRDIEKGIKIATEKLEAGHWSINAPFRPEEQMRFCRGDDRRRGNDGSILFDLKEFFREVLHQMIASVDGRYKIVGDAKDGEEAIAGVDTNAPDLLILDLTMPKKSGLEVIEAVRRKGKQPKMLVLTMSQSKTKLEQAILSGANGYCTKISSRDEILEAVKRVCAGRLYISSDMREAG